MDNPLIVLMEWPLTSIYSPLPVKKSLFLISSCDAVSSCRQIVFSRHLNRNNQDVCLCISIFCISIALYQHPFDVIISNRKINDELFKEDDA